MAQPYFTNQPVPIQQVSPELLMAPGRAMGRAFEKLGQSVGAAMERQYQKQEKSKRADELENFLIGQGVDPDMAKSLKNDKELALNKLKLDKEDEKFEFEKEKHRINAEYMAQQTAIARESAIKSKRERLGKESALDFLRQAKRKEKGTPFADTIKHFLQRGETQAPGYAAEQFISQTDPMAPLPYAYSPAPEPTDLDIVFSQEMTGEAKGQFDKWTKHSNELSSLTDALAVTKNPIDRAKIKRKIDYKTKFLERAEKRIGKLEDENKFFKDKPKKEFTQSYIDRVLAQQGLASPEQQRRITGEPGPLSEAVQQVPTTTMVKQVDKGIDPTSQNIIDYAISQGATPESIDSLRKLLMADGSGVKLMQEEYKLKNQMADLAVKMKKLETTGEASLSEQDGKTWNALTRMDYIEDSLEKLGADVGFGSELGSKFSLNVMKKDERQIYEAYRDNWISANLRKESGAAISDSEMEAARLQYFPVIGDSKKTAIAKKKLREKQREGLFGQLNKSTQGKYNKSGTKSVKEIGSQQFSDPFQTESKYTGGVINFQTGQ